MSYRITVNDETGPIRSYVDVGSRDELMDREYDRGAKSVTVVPVK